MINRSSVFCKWAAGVTAILTLNLGPLHPAELFAQPVELSTESVQTEFDSFSIAKLKLPKSMASIVERHDAGSNVPAVILIQDAHTVPDAQRNIQKTIQYLTSHYGIQNVALEGAADPLDPQILQSFPDQKRLREVLREYSDRGELTGGTAAAILEPSAKSIAQSVQNHSNRYALSPMLHAGFFGLEDWDLYEKNSQKYLEAISHDSEIFQRLDEWQSEILDQQNTIYSPSLRKAAQAAQILREDPSRFLESLGKLAQYRLPNQGSGLEMVWKTGDHLRKDSPQIAEEIRSLSEKINVHLKEGIASSFASRYQSQRQSYQTGKISIQEWAWELKSLTRKSGLKVRVSKELAALADLQDRIIHLRGSDLEREVQVYAEGVVESLIQNDEQRKLVEESHRFYLMQKLAKLELSPGDWQIVKTMAVEEPILKLLELNLEFYRLSEKRDEVFINKIKQSRGASRLSLVTSPQGPATIFVAGGFHTAAIAQKLKEQKISYAVIMPKIVTLPDASVYRDQMQGRVSWEKYLVPQDGKIFYYDGFIRGARDQLLKGTGFRGQGAENEKSIPYPVPRTPHPLILKFWRDQILRDLAAQGRLSESSQYTRFLDELMAQPNPKLKDLNSRWLKAIDDFGTKLLDLQKSGKLSESSIRNLLPSQTIPRVTAEALVPGAFSLTAANRFQHWKTSPEPLEVLVRSEIRILKTEADEFFAEVNRVMKALLGDLNYHYEFHYEFKDPQTVARELASLRGDLGEQMIATYKKRGWMLNIEETVERTHHVSYWIDPASREFQWKMILKHVEQVIDVLEDISGTREHEVVVEQFGGPAAFDPETTWDLTQVPAWQRLRQKYNRPTRSEARDFIANLVEFFSTWYQRHAHQPLTMRDINRFDWMPPESLYPRDERGGRRMLTRQEIGRVLQAMWDHFGATEDPGLIEKERGNIASFLVGESDPWELPKMLRRMALDIVLARDKVQTLYSGSRVVAAARDGMIYMLSDFYDREDFYRAHPSAVYLPGQDISLGRGGHQYESRMAFFGWYQYELGEILKEVLSKKREETGDALREGVTLDFIETMLARKERYKRFFSLMEPQIRSLNIRSGSRLVVYDSFGSGKTALGVAAAIRRFYPDASVEVLLSDTKPFADHSKQNFPSIEEDYRSKRTLDPEDMDMFFFYSGRGADDQPQFELDDIRSYIRFVMLAFMSYNQSVFRQELKGEDYLLELAKKNEDQVPLEDLMSRVIPSDSRQAGTRSKEMVPGTGEEGETAGLPKHILEHFGERSPGYPRMEELIRDLEALKGLAEKVPGTSDRGGSAASGPEAAWDLTHVPSWKSLQEQYRKPQRSELREGTRPQAGGLFHESREVQQMIQTIRQPEIWQAIIDHGAFCFDIEKTLADFMSPLGVEAAQVLADLLRAGVRVAIVTGVPEAPAATYVLDPLKKILGETHRHYLSRLTLYTNDGATKSTINDRGESVPDHDYNTRHQVPVAVADLMAQIVKEQARQKFGLGDRAQAVRDAWVAWVKSRWPRMEIDSSWADGNLDWKPDVLSSTNFWKISKDGGKVTLPAVVPSGASENGYGIINVLHLPASPEDVRKGLVEEWTRRMDPLQLKNLRTYWGGISAIDIVNQEANKAAAILDLIESHRLNIEYVYFFGDQFYRQMKSDAAGNQVIAKQGNDEIVAREPKLKGIHTLGVNEKDPEDSQVEIHIGRGPPATIDFLRQVLARSEKRSALPNRHHAATLKESGINLRIKNFLAAIGIRQYRKWFNSYFVPYHFAQPKRESIMQQFDAFLRFSLIHQSFQLFFTLLDGTALVYIFNYHREISDRLPFKEPAFWIMAGAFLGAEILMIYSVFHQYFNRARVRLIYDRLRSTRARHNPVPSLKNINSDHPRRSEMRGDAVNAILDAVLFLSAGAVAGLAVEQVVKYLMPSHRLMRRIRPLLEEHLHSILSSVNGYLQDLSEISLDSDGDFQNRIGEWRADLDQFTAQIQRQGFTAPGNGRMPSVRLTAEMEWIGKYLKEMSGLIQLMQDICSFSGAFQTFDENIILKNTFIPLDFFKEKVEALKTLMQEMEQILEVFRHSGLWDKSLNSIFQFWIGEISHFSERLDYLDADELYEEQDVRKIRDMYQQSEDLKTECMRSMIQVILFSMQNELMVGLTYVLGERISQIPAFSVPPSRSELRSATPTPLRVGFAGTHHEQQEAQSLRSSELTLQNEAGRSELRMGVMNEAKKSLAVWTLMLSHAAQSGDFGQALRLSTQHFNQPLLMSAAAESRPFAEAFFQAFKAADHRDQIENLFFRKLFFRYAALQIKTGGNAPSMPQLVRSWIPSIVQAVSVDADPRAQLLGYLNAEEKRSGLLSTLMRMDPDAFLKEDFLSNMNYVFQHGSAHQNAIPGLFALLTLYELAGQALDLSLIRIPQDWAAYMEKFLRDQRPVPARTNEVIQFMKQHLTVDQASEASVARAELRENAGRAFTAAVPSQEARGELHPTPFALGTASGAVAPRSELRQDVDSPARAGARANGARAELRHELPGASSMEWEVFHDPSEIRRRLEFFSQGRSKDLSQIHVLTLPAHFEGLPYYAKLCPRSEEEALHLIPLARLYKKIEGLKAEDRRYFNRVARYLDLDFGTEGFEVRIGKQKLTLTGKHKVLLVEPLKNGFDLESEMDSELAQSRREQHYEMPSFPWLVSFIRLLLDALNGLEIFHEAIGVHGDVAPQNIFVSSPEIDLTQPGLPRRRIRKTVLFDYDLSILHPAAPEEFHQRNLRNKGTLLFISPERWAAMQHGDANYRFQPGDDVYGLAKILYQFLVPPDFFNPQRLTFLNQEDDAAQKKSRLGHLKNLHEYRNWLGRLKHSRPMADALLEILDHLDDGKKTYHTAAEFRSDLEKLLAAIQKDLPQTAGRSELRSRGEWSEAEIAAIPEVIQRLHQEKISLQPGFFSADISEKTTRVIQQVTGVNRTGRALYRKAYEIYGRWEEALKAAGIQYSEIAKPQISRESIELKIPRAVEALFNSYQRDEIGLSHASVYRKDSERVMSILEPALGKPMSGAAFVGMIKRKHQTTWDEALAFYGIQKSAEGKYFKVDASLPMTSSNEKAQSESPHLTPLAEALIRRHSTSGRIAVAVLTAQIRSELREMGWEITETDRERVAREIYEAVQADGVPGLVARMKAAVRDASQRLGTKRTVSGDLELAASWENLQRIRQGLKEAVNRAKSEQASVIAVDVPTADDPNLLKPLLRSAFNPQYLNAKVRVSSLESDRGNSVLATAFEILRDQLGGESVQMDRKLRTGSSESRPLGLMTLTQSDIGKALPHHVTLVTHQGDFDSLNVFEKEALLLMKQFEALTISMGTSSAELLKNQPGLERFFQSEIRRGAQISFQLDRFSIEMRREQALGVAA